MKGVLMLGLFDLGMLLIPITWCDTVGKILFGLPCLTPNGQAAFVLLIIIAELGLVAVLGAFYVIFFAKSKSTDGKKSVAGAKE